MNKAVIGLGVVVIAGAGGYYGLTAHATAKAKENIDSAITQFEEEGNGKISYQNIEVNPFSKIATIQNIDFLAADGTEGSIETVEVTGVADKNTIPDDMSITFDNIRLADQSQFEEMKKEFPFIDEFVMDFGLEYSFDEKTGVHSSSLNGGIEELFSFKGDIDLGNIADIWNEMKLAVKEERDVNTQGLKPQAVTLNSLALTAYDDGFLKGIMEIEAAEQNMTVEELRVQTLNELEAEQSLPPSIKPEFVKYLSGEAKQITVTIKPEDDLPLASLPLLAMVPNKEQLIEKFNITVKAE